MPAPSRPSKAVPFGCWSTCSETHALGLPIRIPAGAWLSRGAADFGARHLLVAEAALRGSPGGRALGAGDWRIHRQRAAAEPREARHCGRSSRARHACDEQPRVDERPQGHGLLRGTRRLGPSPLSPVHVHRQTRAKFSRRVERVVHRVARRFLCTGTSVTIGSWKPYSAPLERRVRGDQGIA